MGTFFVDTSSGHVATRAQLLEAGFEDPDRPWLAIQASDDASTLWHSVLVKEVKGVHIGTLTLRHGDHHAFLLRSGWREVPPEEIGSSLPGHAGASGVSPSPWT